MQRIKRTRSRRRSGFTLLEVLLVVGIIALLAAFVVPSFMEVRKGAEEDVAQTMVDSGGTIATQLKLYQMHVGTFPEELAGLYEKPEDEEEADKWRGKYIDGPSKLKDPWGHELQYKFPGEFNEEGFDLWSMGPDGEDGSDDDIGNWEKG